MRKLLLTSSALVAAASISSYAVADVSVTGGFEWKYTQQAADQTSLDGDSFATDNEVVISFSNKTDSGLTVGGKVELDIDTNNPTGGGQTVNDESVLTISGGFGTFRLGQEDSMHETFGITEVDLIDEEGDGRFTGNSISANAGEQGSTDGNKIGYVTPSMGGFKAGISVEDSGASATTDMTAMGASYSMPLANGSLTVKYNQSTLDGATDTDSTNMGAQFSMGAMSLIVSSMTRETGTTRDEEGTGFGIKYDMGGGLTIAASSTEVEDTGTTAGGENEKYTANIGEAVYTVAPGLKAKVTYTDYEYKDGGATGDDSGQITTLTISASF
jgi:outer membrane protein OmpU